MTLCWYNQLLDARPVVRTCLLLALFPWTAKAHAGADDSPRVTLQIGAPTDAVRSFAPAQLTWQISSDSPGDIALPVALTGTPFGFTVNCTDSAGNESQHQLALPNATADGVLTARLHSDVATSGRAEIGIIESGFLFQEPGPYTIRLSLQLPSQPACVESNPVTVDVTPPSAEDLKALSALSTIALHYAGVPAQSLDLADPYVQQALHAEVGKLLARLARRHEPHLVREGNADDERELELVADLRQYLLEFPDSGYAPYVVRFLALVDLKSFEHKVSRLQHEQLRDAKKPLPAQELRDLPEYRSALQLLQKARRMTPDDHLVTYSLGILYVMGQEWTEAEECVRALERNGAPALATRLATETAAFRKKVER